MNLSSKEHYVVRESMQLVFKGYLLLSEFLVVGKCYAIEDRNHLFGNAIFISAKSCFEGISHHILIEKNMSILKVE